MKKELFAAAGIALCLLSGCGTDTSTSYEMGMEKLEEQGYTEAMEYFQNAVQEGDHVVESWRGIGISWTEQETFDRAEEAFVTALEFADSSKRSLKIDLYLYLADARYHQENYQGCISACDELLALQKQKDAYFLRGSAYLHLNDYKNADDNFGRVISGSKDYEDYLDIYRVYQECDLNADGSAYLERALEITPKKAEDYYNRGRVYYYLSEYENAEQELKTALEQEDKKAAIYLGKVYTAMGNLENAKAMYEDCLKEAGLEADAYNGLAYCAIEEGDYSSALSYIENGLKVQDAQINQALLFNQIVAYERTSDFTAAKEKIRAYLELYPGDVAAVRENYFLQTR